MSLLVLGIGDFVVDIVLGPMDAIPAWGTEIEVRAVEVRMGGNLGNFAVSARELGLDLACAGPVGDDDNGVLVRRALATIGCNTDHIVTRPGAVTCISIGFVRDDGERLFVTYPGVLRELDGYLNDVSLPKADVAFFSGWCQPPRVHAETLSVCFARLAAAGTPIAIDLSWAAETWRRTADLFAVLRLADVVLLNQDELAAAVGIAPLEPGLAAFAGALDSRPLVAVKRGSAGAAVKIGAGDIIYATSPPAGAASAVGAGDAFNAAFIAGIFANGLDPGAAATFACDFASKTMRARASRFRTA